MLNTRRKSIAMLYLTPAGMADFVATDVAILRSSFEVRPVLYGGKLHGIPDVLRVLQAVARTNANVSWFGYDQAYLAVIFSRLLGKPSIVVLGGFDVSSEEWPGKRIPEKNERRLKSVLRGATVLLPISETISNLARRFTDRTDLKVVPLGFDPGEFAPKGQKDGSVLTIAYVRRDYLERKGLLPYVRAARLLPELRFYLVGKPLDNSIVDLQREASSNLVFTGWLSDGALKEKLQRAAVYVQASTHEGFGSALAQAMLCECVPVVTDRGAIPEVVGDTGVYVESGDPKSIAKGVRKALENPEMGKRARARVVKLFSLESRRFALLETIRGLTK